MTFGAPAHMDLAYPDRLPLIPEATRTPVRWESVEDVARISEKASPEVGWALKLACLTGLRRADLLRLSWSHVGEFAIEMSTGKSRRKKTAVVPLYAELRELLAVIPRRSPVVLTNSDGHPWKSGFSSSWNKVMLAAGEKTLHFHDARGTFATKPTSPVSASAKTLKCSHGRKTRWRGSSIAT